MIHPKKGLWFVESRAGTALCGRRPAAQRNANSGICASNTTGSLAKNSTPASLCNGRQRRRGCTNTCLPTLLLSVSYVLREPGEAPIREPAAVNSLLPVGRLVGGAYIYTHIYIISWLGLFGLDWWLVQKSKSKCQCSVLRTACPFSIQRLHLTPRVSSKPSSQFTDSVPSTGSSGLGFWWLRFLVWESY